ncbi:MAG: hypothetical protein ACT4QF_24010 [Sporichthyaceae bacterium]
MSNVGFGSESVPGVGRPRRSLALASVVTLAAGGVVALSAPNAAAAIVPIACIPSGSGAVTCEYGDTANIGRFTVPAGVSSIAVTLTGGAGGDGATTEGVGDPGTGGAGGQITSATLAVSGGNVFDVYLGAGGEDASGCGDPGPGGSSGGVSQLAGGSGSASELEAPFYCAGGGGGGGSFLMNGGQNPLTAVPRVGAGGGGGGGGAENDGPADGGNGGRGGPAGSDGQGAGGGQRGEDGGGAAEFGAGFNGSRGIGGAGRDGGGGGGGGLLGGEGGSFGGGGGGGCGGPICPTPTQEEEEEELSISPFRAAALDGGLTITYFLGQSAESPGGPGGPGGGTPDQNGGNAGSNDPNPNTNPNAQPKALPGMDPATATALCEPSKSCRVNPPPGADSRFQIDASGGSRRAVLFATTNGNFQMASVGASRNGVKGRPDCLDYTERNSDWVQFGFLEPATGATWSKTAVMTQRKKLKKAAALKLAEQLQICFAAPYSFPTREGFRAGKMGKDRTGVLADCTSARVKGRKVPCLISREIVEVKGGWTVRLTFRIPANAKDPKALG